MPQEQTVFPDLRESFAVLSEQEILGHIRLGRLIIDDTADESSVQATTYDMRAGNFGIVGGQGKEIDLRHESLIIEPGSYAGIVSLEKVRLPTNLMAIIGAKRKFSYEGVILLTGFIVDPGYEGHLLFGLYNASTKKVVIPSRTKICTILFVQLATAQKPVPPDPALLQGNLPGDFVNKMANMEVLPWSRISEEVKHIQRLTQDVLDLKAKYADVLEPIKALTTNVDRVNNDVGVLARELKEMGSQIQKLENMTGENARQVSDIAASVKLLTVQVGDVKERENKGETRIQQMEALVGSYSIMAKVIWAIFFFIISGLIGAFLKAHFAP